VSLNIRSASPGDALIAAALLAETTGEFGVHVLGLGNAELQFKALHLWFEDKANRFSYEVTSIAESYGMVAGALVAFEGSMLKGLTLGCGRRMLKIYSLVGTLKMLWRNLRLTTKREAEDDEYLIAHLAVAEEFRRQGVAQALLEKAAQDARAANYNKLVLEVEVENYRAIALYRKTGFETIKTYLFENPAASITSPGFHKMVKVL